MNTSLARRILITGAASGIGRETAMQLARRGAHIIVADRNRQGGLHVVQEIIRVGGTAEFRPLDLAVLSDIRDFAADELTRDLPLNVLINNAGILPPMSRAETTDGFELEFGVAYLGHFALTAHLMPALLRGNSPRVVSVSSLAHSGGRIEFDNLQSERIYSASVAYSNAKLACLIFAVELNRRAKLAGIPLISVAAHPGVSVTPIADGWKQETRRNVRDRFELFAYSAAMRLFGQTAAQGAQPLVLAALDPHAIGSTYYGPTGFKQMSGAAGLVRPDQRAYDRSVAVRLWGESERLTGVGFESLKAAR